MTTNILPKLQLQKELLDLCSLIGQTDDLQDLRQYFVRANGLWARIDRLSYDPPKTA